MAHRLFVNKRLARTGLALVFGTSILLLMPHESDFGRPFLSGLSLGVGSGSGGASASANASAYYSFETTSRFFPVAQEIQDKTTEELCASFPHHLMQRIQPVLKMGYSEERVKVEAQLDSVSACFGHDELLIFSDLNETVRHRPVADILADLPDSYRVNNADFENYVVMQDLRRSGRLGTDKNAMAAIDGWRLDKYKFLAIVERAWAARPGRDFYVFYETDTFVVWDNMFRFLELFDPAKPLYMGSPSPGQFDDMKKVKTWFANGGPGFVLSRGAIEKLLQRTVGPDGHFIDPPPTQRWLDLLRRDCCGDSVVGWALWNAGVPLSGFWPMFNPHPMHGVPYSDAYWCQPVLTLHKTTPAEMIEMWRWEFSRRKHGRPLLYADLFEFRNPGTPVIRYDWDNGEWDAYAPSPEDAVQDAVACEQACAASAECMQWLWRGKEDARCVLMRQIRLGQSRPPALLAGAESGRMVDFTSGWNTTRIDEWRAARNCQVVEWVGPSITRIF